MRDVSVLRRVPLPPGGLVPYRKGTLWGFSDTTGRLIIKPQFSQEPSVFINGYAQSQIGEDELKARQEETDRFVHTDRLLSFINAQGDVVSASAAECIVWTPGGLVKQVRRGHAGRPEVVGLLSAEEAVRFGYEVLLSGKELIRHTLADGSQHDVWEVPAAPPGLPEVTGYYLGEGCFQLRERDPGYHRETAVSLIDGTGRNRTWRWERYNEITPFSGGRATVWRGDREGAIDRQGREVVPVEYEGVGAFHHNRAVVTLTGANPMRPDLTQWALIDTMGTVVLGPLRLPNAWPNPAPNVDEEGLVGFPPTPAKPFTHFIIPAGAPPLADNAFDAAEGFSAGRAWVVRKGRVGLIDRGGRWVTPLAYDSLYYVVSEHESLRKSVAVTGQSPTRVALDEYSDPNYLIGYRQGHYGIVDRRTGREVIPARYDWVTAGVGKAGYALLWRNGVRYLLAVSGREVCPFPFGSHVVDADGVWIERLAHQAPYFGHPAYVAIKEPVTPPPVLRPFTAGRWPLELVSEPTRQYFVDTLGHRLTPPIISQYDITWSKTRDRLSAAGTMYDPATGQQLDKVDWADHATGNYAKRIDPRVPLYHVYTSKGRKLTAQPLRNIKSLRGTSWILANSEQGAQTVLLSPSGRLLQAPDGFRFVNDESFAGNPDPGKLGAVRIELNTGGQAAYLSLNGKKLYE